MNRMFSSPLCWLRGLAGAVLALAATLSACGGGDGVGVGGTGGYAQGPIAGFGSVIVNGIRFDDDAPGLVIEAEDGRRLDRSALGLGMTAQVTSGPIGGSADDRRAVAERIRIASELLGRIDAVIPTADGQAAELRILGQSVRVTPATVFGAGFGGGLARLAVGQVVEVYGTTGDERILATRLDLRPTAPDELLLRGVVDDWAPAGTSAGRFEIGAASFDYADLTPPTAFGEGRFVRLRLAPQMQDGRWIVRGIELLDGSAPEGGEAEIEGTITQFTSIRAFWIGGQRVETDASTVFPAGQVIGPGTLVEVEGRVVGGVLRAREVEIEDDSGSTGGDYDLRGIVSGFDGAARTFVLQGQTVDYAQSPRYEGGTQANLGDGVVLRVKARMSSDRTKLVAYEIRFGG